MSVMAVNIDKKLSSCREPARRSMSLAILLSHSRSFEMTLLNRACISDHSRSLEMASFNR